MTNLKSLKPGDPVSRCETLAERHRQTQTGHNPGKWNPSRLRGD